MFQNTNYEKKKQDSVLLTFTTLYQYVDLIFLSFERYKRKELKTIEQQLKSKKTNKTMKNQRKTLGIL